MTASNANNVILSQTSIDGSGEDLGFLYPVTVTISTTEDEENITKTINLITPPKSTSKQEKDTTNSDYGPKDTIVVDILNKVEQRINIDGYLVNDNIGTYANDTNATAQGKKSDLKKLILGGGVVNMKYEGEVFTITTDKISIKRVRYDGDTGNEGVAEFSVKFTAVKGVNFA